MSDLELLPVSSEEQDYDDSSDAVVQTTRERLRYRKRHASSHQTLPDHFRHGYYYDRDRTPTAWGWMLLGIGVLCMGTVSVLIGSILVVHVASVRTHGWTQETCTLRMDTMPNVSALSTPAISCLYFTVHLEDRELCAIPAHVASSGNILHEPACVPHEVLTADPDVRYWFDRANQWGFHTGRDVRVDCLVPMHAALTAKRCMTASTSRGAVASMYSSWADRYTYLMRHNLDGVAAVTAATEPAYLSALGILLAGCVLLVAGSCCFCKRNIGSCTRASFQTCSYRDRRVQQHNEEVTKQT